MGTLMADIVATSASLGLTSLCTTVFISNNRITGGGVYTRAIHTRMKDLRASGVSERYIDFRILWVLNELFYVRHNCPVY